MRRAILMMLLAVVSSSAAAAWVAVGITESGTIYADSATIAKAGDSITMWHLVDFNSIQVKATGRRYISQKFQYEYDCKGERARRLSFQSHTGNMGGGATVDGDWDPQKWEQVPQGGVINYLRQFACGRR